MPRKSIAEYVTEHDEPVEAPEIPAPPVAPPAAAEPESAAPRAQRERAPRAARPRQAQAGRPSARDLAAPARQAIPREALKVDVPAELALLQRLHRRRLDTGIDLRDQVAIAVDEYLTADGY
jgi:hypothetical protein